MGYLSQVVQDARPRAAPSLYAHTPAQPASASEPLSYARLMESSPVSRSDALSAGMEQPVAADISLSEAEEVPQEEVVTPQRDRRVQPARSKRTGTPDPTKPAIETFTPANPKATALSSLAAHNQEQLSTSPKPISGTTPRPASFDLSPSSAQGADPTSGRPSLTKITPQPADAPRADAAPMSIEEQTEEGSRISPRVAVAGQQAQQGIASSNAEDGEASLTPQATPPAPNVFTPSTSTPNTPATEVHIGEVEIIVQDPPAPRIQPAQRPAITAPSPARYHIRRL